MRHHRLFLDLRLRAAGLLLLAIGVLILRLLYQGGDPAAGQRATVGEMASTALAILCVSAGAALVAVGAGLLDPIEISERWTDRAIDRSSRGDETLVAEEGLEPPTRGL